MVRMLREVGKPKQGNYIGRHTEHIKEVLRYLGKPMVLSLKSPWLQLPQAGGGIGFDVCIFSSSPRPFNMGQAVPTPLVSSLSFSECFLYVSSWVQLSYVHRWTPGKTANVRRSIHQTINRIKLYSNVMSRRLHGYGACSPNQYYYQKPAPTTTPSCRF